MDHVVRQVADVTELAFSGPALEVYSLKVLRLMSKKTLQGSGLTVAFSSTGASGSRCYDSQKNLAGLRAYGFLAFRV